jgi:uncharacterized GH25 family protein
MKKKSWLNVAKWSTAIALSSAFMATNVQAHSLWMLPSEFNLSTEDETWITVDATASNSVFSVDKPIALDQVSIYSADGKRHRMGAYFKGHRRSVFDFAVNQEGTYKVELRPQTRYMTLFEMGEKNQRKRIFGNKLEAEIPRGAKKVKTIAVQSIAAFYVTQKGPTDKVLETTGKGFELHALTHPSDIVEQEESSFKFTYNGQPVANTKVDITPHGTAWRSAREEMELTTDEKGVVTFTPDKTGPHLLIISMRKDIDKADEKSVLADSMGVNYHLTFEVLPQ